MIYELRIYDCMPGRLPDLNNRFANITLPLWKKHGIRAVAFWTEEIGTSNRLVYMLQWESLAEREKKFPAFQADLEWQAKRAETEKNGTLVARVENRMLRPTPYSPMQ